MSELARERHRTKYGRLVVEDEASCDLPEFWAHVQTDRAPILHIDVKDGNVTVTRVARRRLFGPVELLPIWKA